MKETLNKARPFEEKKVCFDFDIYLGKMMWRQLSWNQILTLFKVVGLFIAIQTNKFKLFVFDARALVAIKISIYLLGCPVGSRDDVEEGDWVEQDLRDAEHDDPEEMSRQETSTVHNFSKYSFRKYQVWIMSPHLCFNAFVDTASHAWSDGI